MDLWFTSDTHFGHRALIRGGRVGVRPEFSTVEEMDEHLIQEWNSVVGTLDEVYHLGDVSFSRTPRTHELLSRLSGRIHLIRGNHDYGLAASIRESRFESVCDLRHLRVGAGGQSLMLCHFPILSWRDMHHGALHLHGHSHGTLRAAGGRLDVGVDWAARQGFGYRPLHLDEVVDWATRMPVEFVDHHGGG